MPRALSPFVVLVGMTLLAAGGITPPPSQAMPPAAEASHPSPERIADARLPNAVRLHEKVVSGGMPDEASFQALKELGVATIISVDGDQPDVEMAHRFGMRYVHLPHGYDGIPEERARELAKAVRDLDGPIYIHCHHGRHRSPAAAAVACVSAGLIEPIAALDVLRMAGASENYRGLYDSAAAARRLDDALLDALEVEFQESVQVPPLAEAMVGVEHAHDDVLAIAAAGWRSPPAHPDLDPAHEALLLREHFTELLRTDEVLARPAEFQQLLRESETAARELEDVLRAWLADPATAAEAPGAPSGATPPEVLGKSLETITRHCRSCHQKFRDVPLGEMRREE